MSQPGVGHMGIAERQVFQTFQRFQVFQPGSRI
jgi:hypothetical protein